MECSNLTICPFFNDNMLMERGLGSIYKKKYCLGNNTQCARFVVLEKLGPAHVPNNLYPSMLDLANEIINKAEGKPNAD